MLETNALVDVADDWFVETFHSRVHPARIQSVVWGTQTVSKCQEHASHANVVVRIRGGLHPHSVGDHRSGLSLRIIAHAWRHCHLIQCACVQQQPECILWAVKAQHVNTYGRDAMVQAEFTDAARSLVIVDFSLFAS